MLSIDAGAATSTGRVRSVNEDSFFVGSSLFAVADGMGGHRAGDRASALAIEHLAGLEGPHLPVEAVISAIARANEAIAAEADIDDERHGMGTTLVGLSLTELAGSPHWLVFNVGDSRLYELDGGQLHQVTVDHSEVQEMVEAGEITAAEAESHPHRNIITRSVGTHPAPTVDTWLVPHHPGALFLLCSDGLTTELGHDAIAQVLAMSETPQVAADRLVEAAEAAGGRDNITAVVVVARSDLAPATGGAAPGSVGLAEVEQTLPRAAGGRA